MARFKSKRHKLSRKGSRRHFTKNAKRVHKRNMINPQRGGIRA